MMILGLKKPLRHCSTSDLVRHSEVLSVRQSQANRKYSIGLLEEAYQLSKQVGLSKAAKMAEIDRSSLKHYRIIRQKEEGISKPKKGYIRKISNESKKRCYEAYLYLYNNRFSKSHRKCWIEAGKRSGISGRTVEFQYVRGLWKP